MKHTLKMSDPNHMLSKWSKRLFFFRKFAIRSSKEFQMMLLNFK